MTEFFFLFFFYVSFGRIVGTWSKQLFLNPATDDVCSVSFTFEGDLKLEKNNLLPSYFGDF